MITAIIDAGWNTKPRIIGTLVRLGFSGAQGAKIFDEYRGARWRLGRSGAYSVIAG